MASDAQIETNELISATYKHITDMSLSFSSRTPPPLPPPAALPAPSESARPSLCCRAGMARLPALPLNTTPRELTSLLTPLIHDQFSEGEGIILPTPTKTTMLRGCVSGGDTVPSQSDDVIAGG